MINKHKEYGIVYTPEWIVDLILDKTIREYKPNMKICDPACGTGAFLIRLVERICDTLPAETCREALENIVGMDIDAHAIEQCKTKLNAVLAHKGKKLKIKWNLHCLDTTHRQSLELYRKKFDYVVGNPPYVRIQHLGKTRRKRLQKDWNLVKYGSTDLYIAFFEIGLFLLKDEGMLGYITPNTYTKTAAGQPLRQFLLEQHSITHLIDFGPHQLFENATTYSLITILNKYKERKHFSLYRYDGNNIKSEGKIALSHLPLQGIWTLASEETLNRIHNIRSRGRPLKEIADIHVGIQTLADNVFILEKRGECSDAVIVSDMHGKKKRIEKSITRPILKASVMKNGRDIKERVIIFPYNDGKLMKEDDLETQFPMAYQHLKQHKTLLLKRDKGGIDPSRWYSFGREFGLTTSFGPKLITSSLNKKPNFQKCPSSKYTFYAGYCVKPKGNIDIDKLLAALNSDEMAFYIRHISRDYQNGWKSYAKTFIQDYGVPTLSVA